ncbi:MAG TPA: DUF3857 domain-containing protein [Candidatus Acidoferrales bacterium]|nr:DUF3857 domain-containing protein [Candidatus Acidoferrales bacterium]
MKPHYIYSMFWALVALLAFSIFSSSMARAQSASAAKSNAVAAAANPSAPFVIELFSNKISFQNDGTSERQIDLRLKVQSAEANQSLHTLAFDYDASNETFALAFLRITKSDGTSTEAKPDIVSDQPAPVVKTAPAITDIREAQLHIPTLAPGDALSYEVILKTVTPPAPGEFWYEHSFLSDISANDEELQVSVPADRAIHIKYAPQFVPAVTTQGARKIYFWKRTSAAATPVPNSSSDSAAAKNKTPDVELSSFADWQALGKWMGALESAAERPGQEIRDKAAALVANQETHSGKIEALYDFAAKQVTYVRMPMRQANFQPRGASNVLSAGVGDDIDLCALLASLLTSTGFQSDLILLPSAGNFDKNLPTPSAFDHAILKVTAAKDVYWLDPSSDVLPFRMLPPADRNKEVLVISTAAPATFDKTPVDPPFPSTQQVEVNGRVSSLGKLSAVVRYTMRGDNEFALRVAFHGTPQDHWKSIAQTMAELDGFHGQVIDVNAMDPTATKDPFTVSFTIVNENFLDWSQAKAAIALPLPTFGLPDAPQDPAKSLPLGSPLDVTTKLTLSFPANISCQMPVGAAITRDYADYQSHYDAQEHSLTAQRTLRFLAHEIPAARRSDYLAFTHAIEQDESQPLQVANIIPGVPADATTSQLMEAGNAELKSGSYANALLLFEQVAQLAPNQKDLWLDIGVAQLQTGKYEDAATSLQKHLQANPADESANTLLGIALYNLKKYDEAVVAFKKEIAIKPLDPNAYEYLGTVYVDQKKFPEAVSELEKAAVLAPSSAAVRLRLGAAYLGENKNTEALGAFTKAMSLSSSPLIANEAAYQLATHSVALEQAATFALSAVKAVESQMATADLGHLTGEIFGDAAALPAVWDTLGWVRFQQGKLQDGLALIHAAWVLDERGDVGDHLAQIYEKQGEKDRAIQTYVLALAAGGAPPGTRARLIRLLGSNIGIDQRVKRAGGELLAMHTVSVRNADAVTGKAAFLILMQSGAPQPSVITARFLRGDDALSPYGDRIHEAQFPDIFPSGSNARVILRGVLTCAAKTKACSFVFDPPHDLLLQR